MASSLSREGIAEHNRYMLRHYRDFRVAADAITDAWRKRTEVAKIALIGSVANPPWKEVPRFGPFRRAKVELWHECKDLDLALWLTSMDALNTFRQLKSRTLRDLNDSKGIGVASHQIDIFLLEVGTNRYLGRLCDFNRCPKGKLDCLVPDCGRVPFLRQFQDFEFFDDALAPERTFVLFDRENNILQQATTLALPEDDP